MSRSAKYVIYSAKVPEENQGQKHVQRLGLSAVSIHLERKLLSNLLTQKLARQGNTEIMSTLHSSIIDKLLLQNSFIKKID